ncbi:ribonuclease H-like domain-containing protein [Tanacetum coccineum]|uniref:Ribonuclease H-like domain-containing protein n=1 Tax=Tanacetum coccineum TaxID=301880 RepID=A0ABQ5EET6_9ASTR
MASNPENVRLTVIMKLQEALDEEAILEEQMLALVNRKMLDVSIASLHSGHASHVMEINTPCIEIVPYREKDIKFMSFRSTTLKAREDLTFGAWKTEAPSYEALKFIHGPTNTSTSSTQNAPTPFTPDEIKVDKIILSWIFTTLSDSFQKRLVIARPNSAKEAWDFIGDLVKDNKRTHASTLKTELRSIKLGDLSMEAYFQKIESLMTILASLDSPVSDDDVVHYVIDGLPQKYNQVLWVYALPKHLSGFQNGSLFVNYRRDEAQAQIPCISRGLLLVFSYGAFSRIRDSKTTPTPTNPVAYAAAVSPSPVYYSAQPAQPSAPQGPTDNTSQATMLPQAFTTGTLHDPTTGTWNMDTGDGHSIHSIPVTNSGHSILPTTSRYLHLNNVLITPHIVKNLIYARQFVRDNNYTIKFDAFGFSVKDFLTRRVLLHCDSTGDLYPITTPSPIPHAFLCDHGGEFDNRALHKLFADNGIQFRFSCAHTSQQNVPRPTDTNVVRCMWLFRHKFHADGTLSRYKARLMANGNTQIEGVDVDETFSPVVKLDTIRTVLSLATSRHWPVHQLDVKNAFFTWGFIQDSVSLWAQASPTGLVICWLHQEFSMTDLGSLNYFLGISVTQDSSRMFLSQKKYAVEILEWAGMVNCNPCSLQYLTFTRPDISYAVQQVCLHMHDPKEPHFSSLKRILRHVRGSLDCGLQLFSSSTTDLPKLSRSSAEAEYRVLPMLLLRRVGYHQRTKHIEIDIHFVRDLVAAGQVQVLHVPSCYQFADIFTKSLPSALFEEFRFSLSVRCPPAPTAGEC